MKATNSTIGAIKTKLKSILLPKKGDRMLFLSVAFCQNYAYTGLGFTMIACS